jgi:phospholipid/cholesterol/gamma-HCH transport system substrate-binding protein
MTSHKRDRLRRLIVIGSAVVLTATGCTFQGLNSLPLPGTVGQGAGSKTYVVEFANIGTLESNSPVMIDDVVVGSVRSTVFSNWHVDVQVSVKPGVVIPANAVASIGQTSLLGSMHVALGPPVGQSPSGQLPPGATIPLDKSSTYPSTEQTLSSLSTVVNGGGLGQIGDIIHNFNAALSGRESSIRDLLTRLDDFVGVLDTQRDNLIESLKALNRLGATFAEQSDVITRVLREVPPALAVLIRERPRITTALQKLGTFSDTSTRLVNNVQADLVTNLTNLDPTLRALADVGKGLDHALAFASVYPYGQTLIDEGLRGDYMNLYDKLDFTVPRLKRGLLLGTRWGQEGAPLVPAPGEPYYAHYTLDPLSAPFAPQPASPPAPAPDSVPPSVDMPPQAVGTPAPQPGSPASIFAGPYGNSAEPPPAPNGGG